MKQTIQKSLIVRIVIFSASFLFFLAVLVLFCSFKTQRFTDDFLKQLGITKQAADEKISHSFLGGSLDIYGIKNIKNVMTGNRKAVALQLLAYTKQFANSAAYKKEYATMKENYKPKLETIDTPEEFKAKSLANAKKFVADMENAAKTADASLKKVFENALADAKKNLAKVQDPANKDFATYTKNYAASLKMYADAYEGHLARWEKEWPTDHLQFIKRRLEQFMIETNDIDFGAELTTKNGKNYFVKPAYESKSSRWKMAFRAGREVVEPAREFVQKWIGEIK